MTVVEDAAAGHHAQEIVRGDVPGGPSTSQTIMVSNLQMLLAAVPLSAPAKDYRSAVLDGNVLGKQTDGGREWAFRQLRRFYALDPRSLLFRALRDLWTGDEKGHALLAVLCALARDPVLRASAAVVLSAEPGAAVGPSDFALAIENAFPGAYSESTRRTAAQNVSSSWKQSGHLRPARPTCNMRCLPECTPAALTYALLLGDLQGVRGEALFETLWAKVLDQPKSRLFDLAFGASQRGLLEFRHAGGVVEVSFHELLRPFDDDSQRQLL